jgi:hypothetical protein
MPKRPRKTRLQKGEKALERMQRALALRDVPPKTLEQVGEEVEERRKKNRVYMREYNRRLKQLIKETNGANNSNV